MCLLRQRLKAPHAGGKRPAEFARLRQIGLILVDEVGHIPFEQYTPAYFSELVSTRACLVDSGIESAVQPVGRRVRRLGSRVRADRLRGNRSRGLRLYAGLRSLLPGVLACAVMVHRETGCGTVERKVADRTFRRRTVYGLNDLVLCPSCARVNRCLA